MSDQWSENKALDVFSALHANNVALRIVLVGKTGTGKSASGNTILRQKVFRSTKTGSSVTIECQKKRGEFGGQTLEVIDTPGLSAYEVKREMTKCLSLASPGPHTFLIVIQVGRFTKEEQSAVKIFKEMFGEAAVDHSMILFTHGDDLKANNVSIEDFINGDRNLRDLVRQFKGRYHVLDNRAEDPSQVRELLMKVNSLVQRNGGKFYTDEMFREAERDLRQRNQADYQGKMSGDKAKKQPKPSYRWHVITGFLAICGAAFGSRFGPVGAAVGAFLGTAVAVLVRKVFTMW